MQATLTTPDVQLYEKHTLSYHNVLSFSKIFFFFFFFSDFPEPTWTTASLINSNDHKLQKLELEIIIDRNIKQYSCDARIVTAPTVLEVIEAPVLPARNKR